MQPRLLVTNVVQAAIAISCLALAAIGCTSGTSGYSHTRTLPYGAAALFPTAPAASKTTVRSVESCTSVDDCLRLSDEYPSLESMALDRAVSHLANVDEIERLSSFAIAYPRIEPDADSMAAAIARESGDYSSYLDAFSEGISTDQFRGRLDSILGAASTIEALASMADRHPFIKERADSRAYDMAITRRQYRSYLSHFPHGIGRAKIDALVENERSSLLLSAEDHVASRLASIRSSGRYRRPTLADEETPVSGYFFTDWDGDGDDDLYFSYRIVGDNLWDGKGSIVEGLCAVENVEGRGHQRAEVDVRDLLPDRPFARNPTVAFAKTADLWLSVQVRDPRDHVLHISFDGAHFTYEAIVTKNGRTIHSRSTP